MPIHGFYYWWAWNFRSPSTRKRYPSWYFSNCTDFRCLNTHSQVFLDCYCLWVGGKILLQHLLNVFGLIYHVVEFFVFQLLQDHHKANTYNLIVELFDTVIYFERGTVQQLFVLSFQCFFKRADVFNSQLLDVLLLKIFFKAQIVLFDFFNDFD